MCAIHIFLALIIFSPPAPARKPQLPSAIESSSEVRPFDHDYTIWKKLVNENVKMVGGVQEFDYLNVEKKELFLFLSAALEVKEGAWKKWSREERIAFLLNTHNALTVKHVLSRYPNLQSIKDLGGGFPFFKTAWEVKFFDLFGSRRNLEYLKRKLQSTDLMDPRIPFGLITGARGGPGLRVFTPGALDSQLEGARKDFISNKHFNRVKSGRLEVSKLFDWHKDSIASENKGNLSAFFADHSQEIATSEKQRAAIKGEKLPLQFVDFDWELNDLSRK